MRIRKDGRIFAYRLLVVFLLVLMIFLYSPVRIFVENRMTSVRNEVLDRLESMLGRKIAYESISPSVLRYVEIRNLRIYMQDRQSDLLRIQSLKIKYRLIPIIFGRYSEAFDEIIIENSTVRYDSENDSDLKKLLQSVKDSGEREGEQKPPNIKVTGKNIRLEYISPEQELFAEHVFFQLAPGDKVYSLRLRAFLRYRSESPSDSLRQAEAMLDLQTSFTPGIRQAEATLGLSGVSTNLFTLEKQTVQLTLDENLIRLRKTQDSEPLDLSFVIDTAKKTLQGEFTSAGFRPGNLFSLKGKFSPYNEWLGTRVTAKGSFLYDFPKADISYAFDMHAFFKNSIIPNETQVKGEFSGTRAFLKVHDAEAFNNQGMLSFSGDVRLTDYLPEGKLELSRVTYFGREPLGGLITLQRTSEGLSIDSDNVNWGRASLYAVSAQLSFEKSAQKAALRFSLDKEMVSAADLSLVIPGGQWEKSLLAFKFTHLPLEGLRSIAENLYPNADLSVLDANRNLMTSGIVYGRFQEKDPVIDIPELSVFDGADTGNSVSLSLRYGQNELRVSRAVFDWNGYYGNGRLNGTILANSRIDFLADLSIMDVPYTFEALFDPTGYARVTGKYGVQAELFWQNGGPAFGSLTIADFPLPMLQKTAYLNGKADFFYESMESWSVEVQYLELRGISPLPHLDSRISASMGIGPDIGILHEVQYTDQFSTVFGDGLFSYSTESGTLQLDLSLNDKEKKELYSFSFQGSKDELRAGLFFDGSPAGRFVNEDFSGTLKGSIDVSGSLASPVIRTSIMLGKGAFKKEPVSLRIDGQLSREKFILEYFDFHYRDYDFRNGNAEIDFIANSLQLTTVFQAKLPNRFIDWKLSIDLENPNGLQILSPALFLKKGLAGSVTVNTEDKILTEPYRSWRFDIKSDDVGLAFSGGPGNSVTGYFTEEGAFQFKAGDPLPVSFEAAGQIQGESIDMNINRIVFNIDDFSRFLDLQIIKFLRGRVTGDLRISGSLRDPNFFGALSVSQAWAKLSLAPDEIGPLRGNLIFREKEFTLQPLIARVGKGAAEVNLTFLIDQWIPRVFTINVDTKLNPGIRIENDFEGIIVKGTGQGKVKIEGDYDGVTVSGKLYASNTVITIGDISKTRENSGSATATDLKVDLEIETGKSVEFYWPTENFPIIQTFASVGEKLNIKVDQAADDLHVQGDINIRGGQVYYFDRSFYLREGTIRFNERKDSFDPIISARAEIRESTANGLVRIYLVADNTKLSQFSPRFESDGGLTTPEILTILGRNFLNSDYQDSINLSSALLLSSDVLTQIGLVRNFEKDMRKRLNLDLFSIRTHIFQNLLQGVVTSDQDLQTDSSTSSVGRYLDKTSVFLGKYIGSDLFLEYLLQLRADDPLTSEIREFGGMDIESEIILEWKTPFFVLETSLLPKHPEEFFIRDATFTFRWRYSY